MIKRIIEQWNIIKECFLTYLPTIDKKIESNDKYVQIKNFITDKLTFAKFHFIRFLCQTLFKREIVWLQEEQPLIHL